MFVLQHFVQKYKMFPLYDPVPNSNSGQNKQSTEHYDQNFILRKQFLSGY